MSDFIPTNDLDRVIAKLQRSQAAMPEFYRQLAAGELWFLVPFHPEVEGEELELKNGSPLPFARLMDAEGEVVPLFSSEERLEEGLKKGRVPPRTYSAGSMPARQVLEILGSVELRAIINKGCATGQIIIPPDLMRDLADGSALKPPAQGQEKKQGRLKILDPADYPTALVQAVFEFVRQHRNFRAAWIFGVPPKVPSNAGYSYQLLFLMSPRDDAMFHDLNITVQSARTEGQEVDIGLLDETDTAYIEKLFSKAPAFYQAANFQRPGSIA